MTMEQMVKSYSSPFLGGATREFHRDAERLAKEGWRIQSQMDSGHGTFVFQRQITVVYVRETGSQAQQAQ